MTREDEIGRGREAAQELRITEEAFSSVEAAIIRALGETPVGADVKIIRLHMSLQNLAAVRQAVRSVIDSGQMAEAAVAQAGLLRVV
jgi:hypothetical protein